MFGLVMCIHGNASRFGDCDHDILFYCNSCGSIVREDYGGALCERCGEELEEV